MDKDRLDFLKQIYSGCRGEIEMRITQRDNFAIQFIVAVGAVFTLGFLDFTYAPFLFFILPLVTIFYTVQILYSYTIHDRLHKFLVSEIEPEIARQLNFSDEEKNKYCWESFCEMDSKQKGISTPGIRKGFFIKASFTMPTIAAVLFIGTAISKTLFSKALFALIIGLLVDIVFTFIIFMILHKFNRPYDICTLNKLAHRDYIQTKIKKDKNKKKAIFLDRDGTLHIDKVMTHKVEDLEYFTDTFSAIKSLSDLGFVLVIVTNQNGIRNGVYTEKDMHRFNKKIIDDFKLHGIQIGAIYYSPYDSIDNHISYKPNNGMLLRAMYELNIDMKSSYLIGDQTTDILAAIHSSVKPIMVTTGIYRSGSYKTEEYNKLAPITFSNLTEASKYILNTK